MMLPSLYEKEIINTFVNNDENKSRESNIPVSITPNATFWHGEKEGVLYRRQFWEYGTDTETHWRTAIDLADFAMPYGIMRADKIRLFRRPIRLTLGSFGFPDNGTDIQIREKAARLLS